MYLVFAGRIGSLTHISISKVILDSYHQAAVSEAPITEAAQPELVLISANTETALKEQISRHQEYILSNSRLTSDIAYTCALHREHLPYRSYLVVENGEFVELAPGFKASQTVLVVNMVFGGQGAQWPEMGKELILADRQFREDILKMDRVMKGLKFPPDWNLTGTYYFLHRLKSTCLLSISQMNS